MTRVKRKKLMYVCSGVPGGELLPPNRAKKGHSKQPPLTRRLYSLVGCSPPFIRLAELLTGPRAW